MSKRTARLAFLTTEVFTSSLPKMAKAQAAHGVLKSTCGQLYHMGQEPQTWCSLEAEPNRLDQSFWDGAFLAASNGGQR